MHRFVTRALGALSILLLASCSQFPLPAEIDLRAHLSDAAGTVQEPIGEGEAGSLDVRHPHEDGECLDFSEEEIRATVEKARLHYDVSVDYEGPELGGRLQARLHAARERDDVWLPENRVGPTITVDLDDPHTELAGTAVLNESQLQAINDRQLCWGVHVTGEDIAADGTGTGTFSYRIDELRLAILFSVL